MGFVAYLIFEFSENIFLVFRAGDNSSYLPDHTPSVPVNGDGCVNPLWSDYCYWWASRCTAGLNHMRTCSSVHPTLFLQLWGQNNLKLMYLFSKIVQRNGCQCFTCFTHKTRMIHRNVTASEPLKAEESEQAPPRYKLLIKTLAYIFAINLF